MIEKLEAGTLVTGTKVCERFAKVRQCKHGNKYYQYIGGEEIAALYYNEVEINNAVHVLDFDVNYECCCEEQRKTTGGRLC